MNGDNSKVDVSAIYSLQEGNGLQASPQKEDKNLKKKVNKMTKVLQRAKALSEAGTQMTKMLGSWASVVSWARRMEEVLDLISQDKKTHRTKLAKEMRKVCKGILSLNKNPSKKNISNKSMNKLTKKVVARSERLFVKADEISTGKKSNKKNEETCRQKE